MKIEVHPEASEEIAEAAEYYDRQRQGLGLLWVSEFEATVRRIEEAPERWEALDRGIRRHSFKRFSYCVLYRVSSDTLRIVAVKHHSRDPNYWKHRLEGFD